MDPMEALRAADPARRKNLGAVDARALDALREGIMMTARTASSRRRRLWVPLVGIASIGVLGTAGAAIAGVFGGQDANGLDCYLGEGIWSVPWRTGDAVADCTAIWAEQGIVVEDVVAFSLDGQTGAAPRDQVPGGATLIDAADGSTPATVELGYSLADWVDGGASLGCPADEEMVAWVESDLDRLGLTDWTVQVLPPDDGQPCASPTIFEPGVVSVVHESTPEDRTGDGELATIARALRAGITEQCLTVDEARDLADAQLATLEWEPQPTFAVTDEEAACARVDMMVGGDVFMRVYGPTTVD